ncbi:hypothetical protein PC116_g27780 [Phytophthora cactorum]|uniref:Retroviral polymerase SH3-like domain-containing protein n=1 Tax=Phytophthora cactorum TaxID=29920 RepID=A0A8T1EAG1_9STRA|nr:hypothetical protein PC117_g27201 [Phytophthora cactorum]KAG2880327.1 hypothetical protein PC114_g22132 [Phytophthora cactorum]KAG2951598.1 hypothetical protein PC118_g25169 [Phytophthora cactorum]KAG4223758.1 hypothetical protein PC116_g27780 [Phytophthora cactorum]
MMFGIKPDLHHIRKFGALAYVHVPVTPGRKKHHDNAKLGFVLGYAEDIVGCKVFFPDDRTAKFVADTQVTMDLEGGEADEAPNLPEADESPDLLISRALNWVLNWWNCREARCILTSIQTMI